MNYKILTIEDSEQWKGYLRKLSNNQQDIYYFPEYYSLYEQNSMGKVQCFVFYEENKVVLYPFLKNNINNLGYNLDNQYYDIQGAYGYNGPISNTNEKQFLSKFSSVFCKFCLDSNIVAEFTRFNPLLNNQHELKYIEPIHTNDVINIDLSIAKEQIWLKSYESDTRRIIKKGISIGYEDKTILIGKATNKDIDDFISIYYSTLKRNTADNFYFFTKEFIYNFRSRMPENVLLSLAYFENKTIGGSINPFHGINAYGLLGGSLQSHKKISPFTFLTHKVIEKLKDLGVKNYLIGGGIKPDDNIFKYKKGFSRIGAREFFIGKKIHNQKIYEIIIRQWKEKTPDSYNNNSNKLLGYREI